MSVVKSKLSIKMSLLLSSKQFFFGQSTRNIHRRSYHFQLIGCRRALCNFGNTMKCGLSTNGWQIHFRRGTVLRTLGSTNGNTSKPIEGERNSTKSHYDDAISFNKSHWEYMFEALKQYKSTHGDTLVPCAYTVNPPLGNWVDNQRQAYRMRLENEQSPPDRKKNTSVHYHISDERIAALDEIGFVWSLHEHAWALRYDELKEYIAEHGNSLVPLTCETNPGLAMWVAKQRRKYKVGHEKGGVVTTNDHSESSMPDATDDSESSETGLSEERIRKLEEIGFVWDVHEAQWLERYEELKKYKRDHGDTNVHREYPLLGRWVEKQRLDYRRYWAKKKKEAQDDEKNSKAKAKRIKTIQDQTGMTEERIRLLNEIDFIWDPFSHAWEQKFKELCDFVAVNGHTAVKMRKGSNKSLASWVGNQRQNYRKLLKGEKSPLTEERIKKLNSIGFLWDGSSMREAIKSVKSKGGKDSKKKSKIKANDK